MSDDQPDLLRKLLGEDAAADASGAPAPPSSSAAIARTGARPLIQVEPDVEDALPRRSAPPPKAEPRRDLRRFGPSAWPRATATRRGRVLNLAIVTLAVAGGIAGLAIGWYHLTTDPLADAHAYFDAAVRLNHGQSLYPPNADPNAADYYRYPPLLAVVLRPIVLLGWPAFAAIWEAVVVASFVLLLRRLRLGSRTLLALGILAMPTAWCLAIGQAQVPLTLLVAIGQPWSIALAANLKLFPALAALWWIGRRDGQATGAFIGWVILLGLVQTVLEPTGAVAFVRTLGFNEVGQVLNISPYAIAPWTWAALVGLGVVVVLLLARTPWGWVAAVTLATLSSPRLLLYMLMSLLAAAREPEIAGLEEPARPFQPVRYGRRG